MTGTVLGRVIGTVSGDSDVDVAATLDALVVDEPSLAVLDVLAALDVLLAAMVVEVVDVVVDVEVLVVAAAGFVVTTGGVKGVGPTSSAGSAQISPADAFLSSSPSVRIATAPAATATATIAGSTQRRPACRAPAADAVEATGCDGWDGLDGWDGSPGLGTSGGGKSLTGPPP